MCHHIYLSRRFPTRDSRRRRIAGAGSRRNRRAAAAASAPPTAPPPPPAPPASARPTAAAAAAREIFSEAPLEMSSLYSCRNCRPLNHSLVIWRLQPKTSENVRKRSKRPKFFRSRRAARTLPQLLPSPQWGFPARWESPLIGGGPRGAGAPPPVGETFQISIKLTQSCHFLEGLIFGEIPLSL